MSKTYVGRIDNRYRWPTDGKTARRRREEARMDLDLRSVRYFVAVAEELHFGRAAARLYISQPALSKQIRRLEEQLDASLLVRDSRHVTLTPRGERFLDDARHLLGVAARMQRSTAADTVRIAHIFELSTSRLVADAFARAHPHVHVIEQQQDSYRQLRALLDDQIDVAIIRVTAQKLRESPTGWRHAPLRLEPMLLIGHPNDEPHRAVSLRARPIEIFADPPESGLYNAHGDYMTALEQHLGLSMKWLGNPGTFLNCMAHLHRLVEPGFVLDFQSYALRYADAGLPVHRPAEVQPYYPWSIAWRDEEPSQPVADLLRVALHLADANNWQQPDADAAPPWLPAETAAPDATPSAG